MRLSPGPAAHGAGARDPRRRARPQRASNTGVRLSAHPGGTARPPTGRAGRGSRRRRHLARPSPRTRTARPGRSASPGPAGTRLHVDCGARVRRGGGAGLRKVGRGWAVPRARGACGYFCASTFLGAGFFAPCLTSMGSRLIRFPRLMRTRFGSGFTVEMPSTETCAPCLRMASISRRMLSS